MQICVVLVNDYAFFLYIYADFKSSLKSKRLPLSRGTDMLAFRFWVRKNQFSQVKTDFFFSCKSAKTSRGSPYPVPAPSFRFHINQLARSSVCFPTRALNHQNFTVNEGALRGYPPLEGVVSNEVRTRGRLPPPIFFLYNLRLWKNRLCKL